MRLELNRIEYGYLEFLRDTGLFGLTIQDVCLRLIDRGIQQAVAEGWPAQPMGKS